ncbi:MAG: ribosome small subunit-dependent GTPase A, partial [Pseudonocardiaceae bacterium]
MSSARHDNALERYAAQHRDGDDNDERFRRPGRGSRPRGKRRPTHADAVLGFVVVVDRGRYTCRLVEDTLGETAQSQTAAQTQGQTQGGLITAMRARELGRRAVVVGDYVHLVGDVSAAPGSLARIVRIEPRRSQLRRSTEEGDSGERVVVANAQRLVIVVALTDPPPRTGLIDRCLVAAYDAGIQPLLCLTKADMPGADTAAVVLRRYYDRAGLHYVTTRYDQPVTELADTLTDGISVLVGHSGVGKSTLVNALVPDARRAIGELTGVGKGRHTTTAALALALPAGGWIIDTPGIRTFGLAHIDTATVLASFGDLIEATTRCAPGCHHRAREPECGLDIWV